MFSDDTQDKKAKKLTKDQLVERAKNERLSRHAAREQSVFAVKIQSWFRGRYSARNHFKLIDGNLHRKLEDIIKLHNALATKNVKFCPPVVISYQLTCLCVYLHRKEKVMFIVIFQSSFV